MSKASVDNKLDQLLKLVHDLERRVKNVERPVANADTATTNSPGTATNRTQPQPSPQRRKHLEWIRGRIFLPLYRYIWVPVLGFLALYGGIATYISLRFDVSVVSYVSLNTSNPDGTRFLVTNESPFDIHQVFYACKYIPPHAPEVTLTAYATVVPFPIASLRPHGNFSAWCSYPALAPRPIKDGTLLDVEIMYTPKFLSWQSRRGGELFLLKSDEKGVPIWLPAGDMTPRADDLQKLSCPTCAQ